MPLVLAEIQPSDFPRVFAIVSDAFEAGNAYVDAVYPRHKTPDGRREGAAQMLEEYNSAPYATWLKVVDPDAKGEEDGDGGKIIGMARWAVFENRLDPPSDELSGPWWDDGKGDKAFAQAMVKACMKPSWEALREEKGNLVSLELIAVDPNEKRRGAGRMLMQWGTEQADRLGFKMTVEATDEGRLLYESVGFKHAKTVTLDLPPPYRTDPPGKFAWLERLPKTNGDRP